MDIKGERKYTSSEDVLWLKWKEDGYATGVKKAEVVLGLRGDNAKIYADVYYGDTKIKSLSTNRVLFENVNISRYVGTTWRWIHLKVHGRGWVEAFKIMLVESCDVHRYDRDGDRIRDDWEIKGWMWNYDKNERYRSNGGFHTNPVSKDTDGDGYDDGIDADPLHNLVLRMSLEKYTYGEHPDYTKFAGFWAKWELNGNSKAVKYFTVHKDHTPNLHGYVYWFDVPDDIDTRIDVKAGAFYNDWGDKKLGDWSGSFGIRRDYKYYISVGSSDPSYEFEAQFWVYPLSRVHSIAVYNESLWNGRYLYSGNYYILYVESSSAQDLINSGLNVIIVPSVIFVNSQLYKKIKDGDISYLKGEGDGKMGAIGAKNVRGKRFANYAVITPAKANLPEDVLGAIPYAKIENSATGSEPKDLWGQVVSEVTNLVIKVVQFIYNGLVAIGECKKIIIPLLALVVCRKRENL